MKQREGKEEEEEEELDVVMEYFRSEGLGGGKWDGG